MVLDLSKKPQKPSRKALVFGEKAVAERIAKQLRSEGIEAVLQVSRGIRLPSIADPNSLRELRSILGSFAQEVREKSAQPLIHPGNTVWAERPELASIGEELGVSVIGPPPRVLSFFSNKLHLLWEAERLGIPHLVQSFDPIHTVREIEAFIRRSGQTYPFVLKAVRGGGSFGLFVVTDENVLQNNVPLWFNQLRRNLGEVILFAERYLEGARHISVPFVRFQDGRIQIFPLTDASLQCRYRKVVEFCPANRIDPIVEANVILWTQRLAESCGYVGVGVLEYLVDTSRTFLVESLARLNTGFHLWEEVAGTQAVSWQLATHMPDQGKTTPEILDAKSWEPAVMLRVYAEDCLLHLPQPGVIHELSDQREWEFPGARAEVSMNYEKGETVSISDSGMIALITIQLANRRQLSRVLRHLFSEFWIAGTLQTNERFLLELMSHPWVKEEIFHAGFVDEEFLPALRPPVEFFFLAASVCAQFSGAQDKARWHVGDQVVDLNLTESVTELEWEIGPHSQENNISGILKISDRQLVRVYATQVGEKALVRIGAWSLFVRMFPKTRKPRISALISGRVHAVLFREGVTIPAHEQFLILEAFGIFVPHALSIPIRVDHWKVKADQIVQSGQDLADFNGSFEKLS